MDVFTSRNFSLTGLIFDRTKKEKLNPFFFEIWKKHKFVRNFLKREKKEKMLMLIINYLKSKPLKSLNCSIAIKVIYFLFSPLSSLSSHLNQPPTHHHTLSI